MPICSVSGCENTSRSKGLCNKHLLRLKHTGTTDPGPKAQAPIEERFMRHFEKRDIGECWPWNGNINHSGYGVISKGGKKAGVLLAHRLSWEIANNQKIVRGKAVLHSCDNPKCVNPLHLRLGTQSDNVRDMQAKGRHVVIHVRGQEHHSAQFTEKEVIKIRASTKSNRDLADHYGVHISSIRKIRSRVTWRHIP